MRHHPFLVPSLLLVLGLPQVPAAEEAAPALWTISTSSEAPPAGWTWRSAPGSATRIRSADDAVAVTAPAASWAWLDRAYAGADGQDAQPLAISVRLAVGGPRPVSLQPALLVVRWGAESLVAVGLQDDPDRPGRETRLWAGLRIEGKTQVFLDAGESLLPGNLVSVRVLVVSRAVLVQGSRDGSDWRTLTRVPRTGPFASRPTGVSLGRGWCSPEQPGSGLEALPAKAARRAGDVESVVLRFAALRAEVLDDRLPADATKSYQRKDSLAETRELLEAATIPAAWELAGPFAITADPLTTSPQRDATGPLVSGATVSWSAPAEGTGRRFLELDELLPSPGDRLVRYARCRIQAEVPRLERLTFDGLREVALFVNGQRVATTRPIERRFFAPDRCGVTVPLRAGDNEIVARIGSSGEQARARFQLRHAPADGRTRVAIARRLANDFPSTGSAAAQELLGIGRTWEQHGHLALAGASYREAAAVEACPGEDAAEALTAAVRVHALLDDQAAVGQDMDDLAKRWAEDGLDAVQTALRGARLQALLGHLGLAVATLDRAVAGATGDDRTTLAGERLRLLHTQGDLAQVVAGQRQLAGMLAPGDPRTVPVLLAADRVERRRGAASGTAAPDLAPAIAAGLTGRRPDDLLTLLLAAQLRGQPTRMADVGKALIDLAQPGDPRLVTAADLLDDTLAGAALERFLGTPGPADTTLPARRLAALTALIGQHPAGRDLLAALQGLPPATGTQVGAGPFTWQALGPFPNPNFSRYAKPPVDPAAPDLKATVEGRTWRPIVGDAQGAVDLMGHQLAADNAVVLLTTTFAAPADGAYDLSCGADDGLVVWLNGTKVHEDRQDRPLQPDSLHVPLAVRAGVNRLTVMVQNGMGGTAFQARLQPGPYPAAPLRDLLADSAAATDPAARRSVATRFIAFATGQMHADQPATAALVATALTAFPGQTQAAFDLAITALGISPADHRYPTLAPALPTVIAWLQRARQVDLLPEREDLWRDLTSGIAERLRRLGAYEEAAQVLRQGQWCETLPRSQAGIGLQWAGLWRETGHQQAAQTAAERALGDPDLADVDVGWWRNFLAPLRTVKSVQARIEPAFEAVNGLRSLEHQLQAKDLDAAIPAAQKILEDWPDEPIPRGQGTVPAGRLVLALLAEAGPAAADTFRERFDGPAGRALRQAALAADPLACERVVRRYPLCPSVTGPALLRAAELYADRGDTELAQATAAAARPLLTDPAWQARAQALADRPLPPPAKPVALAVVGREMARELPVADAADLARVPQARLVPSVPVQVGAVLVGHDAAGSWGRDAANGALRWRHGNPATVPATAPASFQGLPVWTTATDGQDVVVRERTASGRLQITVRSGADGALRWTSADQAAVAGWSAVSSPALAGRRVYAAFADADGGRHLASWDLGSGAVRWITGIPGGDGKLPAVGEGELRLAGHAAAPTVVGRRLWWCSDAGVVAAVDAASGALRWVTPYPRAVVDPQDALQALVDVASRAPGRVVACGDLIAVTPRDTRALLALDPDDGRLRWQQPLLRLRELLGDTAGPTPLLIAQGDALQALDARTGAPVWRQDLATAGTALLESAALSVATPAGILTLAPATGQVQATRPWTGSPLVGTVLRAGDGYLVVTPERMAGVAAAPATPAIGSTEPPRMAPEPPLLATGLTEQPDGPDLGLAWRWAGTGPVLDLLSAADGSDEHYVIAAGRIGRFSALPTPRLVWSTACTVGNGRVALVGETLVVTHGPIVTAFARSDGRRLATSLVDGVGAGLFGSDPTLTVTPGTDHLAVFHDGWPDRLAIVDPATGALRQNWGLPDQIFFASQRGNRVSALLTNADRPALTTWTLGDPGQGRATPLPIPLHPRELQRFAVDPDRWLLAAKSQTWRVDLASGEVRELPTKGTWSHLRSITMIPETRGITVFRESNFHGQLLHWNDAGGLVIDQECGPLRPIGFDQGYACTAKGEYAAPVFSLGADGAKRWTWEPPRRDEVRTNGLVAVGRRLLVLQSSRKSGDTWVLIGSEGKPVAEGTLPGSRHEGAPARTLGGRIWLGTDDGLVVLAPVAARAGKALDAGPTVPVAVRAIRDLAQNPAPPALTAPLATAVLGGGDGPWPAPAFTFTPGSHREPARPGGGVITGGGVALRYDDAALGIRIEIDEATGAAPSVAIALDALRDGGEKEPPPVLGLREQQGRTEVRLLAGRWPGEPAADQPGIQAQAVRTLSGWRFTCAIPWPMLRPPGGNGLPPFPPFERPVRCGIAITVPGDTVEMGHSVLVPGTRDQWALITCERPRR